MRFSLDLIYSAVLKACKQAECVNALVYGRQATVGRAGKDAEGDAAAEGAEDVPRLFVVCKSEVSDDVVSQADSGLLSVAVRGGGA